MLKFKKSLIGWRQGGILVIASKMVKISAATQQKDDVVVLIQKFFLAEPLGWFPNFCVISLCHSVGPHNFKFV